MGSKGTPHKICFPEMTHTEECDKMKEKGHGCVGINEEKKKSKKSPFRILGKVSMLLHLGLPKKILSETEKVKYYKTKSSEEEKEKLRKGKRKGEGEKGRKTGEEKKTKLENEEQNLVIVPTPQADTTEKMGLSAKRLRD